MNNCSNELSQMTPQENNLPVKIQSEFKNHPLKQQNYMSVNEELPVYKQTWFQVAVGIAGSALLIGFIEARRNKKPTHENISGF